MHHHIIQFGVIIEKIAIFRFSLFQVGNKITTKFLYLQLIVCLVAKVNCLLILSITHDVSASNIAWKCVNRNNHCEWKMNFFFIC